MRRQFDLKAAIDALTLPRILHTTQPDPRTREPRVRSIQHPALIDLLENGTGTSRGSAAGAGGGGAPGPIDAGALETWAQIRDQVRAWIRQVRTAKWSDDLKTDLRTWYLEHEIAVALGRVSTEALDEIERIVEAWVARIEAKYDPDERREWTDPCPAVVRVDDRTGHVHRCGARRIMRDGTLQFAVTVNVTRRTVECHACGRTWEGERELFQFRYQANLADAERALEHAAQEPPAGDRRELAMTGPIDLPGV